MRDAQKIYVDRHHNKCKRSLNAMEKAFETKTRQEGKRQARATQWA